MSGFKFEQFQDVVGSATDNPLIMKLSGSQKSIEKIKQKLTLTDKSALWKYNNAQKKLSGLNARFSGVDESRIPEYFLGLMERIRNEISDLSPKITQCLFTEIDNKTIEVPAGFWAFCGKVEGNLHLNTEIEPIYVDRLRDYQREAVGHLLKYKRATVSLSTGLGKTVIISSICKSAVRSGKRVCVVVPTEYLVGQVVDTVSSEVDGVVGYGGNRKALPLGANVLVVTAASAKKFISSYDVIAIDESHHSAAATWVDLFSSADKATHVYNLTATAFRADGLDAAIHAFGGPTVYERDVRWGIEAGWLKKCAVYLTTIRSKRSDGSHIVLGDSVMSQKAYKILAQNPSVLSFLKEKILSATKKDRKVIVLFKTVAACQALSDFCKPEINIEVASSKFKKPIDDFRSGNSRVLLSNDKLLSEGIDIPDADALLLVTNHSSDVTTYQAVGRVLRKGDKEAAVVDVLIAGYKQFERAAHKRAKTYKNITNKIVVIGER